MIDAKRLGERFRMIRKHLGITQLQLAEATKLTQPAISRIEKGEGVNASALLAVLDFYRDKVSLDYLLDPNLDETNKDLLYCSLYDLHHKIKNQLGMIAHDIEESQKKLTALKNQL